MCGNIQCFVSRIEFLIIPAVALALLINHDYTVLEVSSISLSLYFSWGVLVIGCTSENHTKGEKFFSNDIWSQINCVAE